MIVLADPAPGLSQLGSVWHMLCTWLVLDGVWCWIGPHRVHCERHPPVLSLLIAPQTPGEGWLPISRSAYAAASAEDIGSVCLGLLLYGIHVWRRLAEECLPSLLVGPGRQRAARPSHSAARMHVAHYLFGVKKTVSSAIFCRNQLMIRQDMLDNDMQGKHKAICFVL